MTSTPASPPAKRALRAAAALACLGAVTALVGSCGDEDTVEICEAYAEKLVDCGIIEAASEGQQADICITLVDAGGDDASYRCVRDTACAEINSKCGI